MTSLGEVDTASTEQIRELFPKATRIEPRREDLPVWPVYQLDELLGYAYQSSDLVHLPGFSGDEVNMLIGIDTAGRFAGVRVLHHHEPIFVHGLGPQPMLEFIAQYPGHKLSDRIIVGGGNRRSLDSDATVHFDGVTKATVSVIVINDTILSSALQVARATLSEFAKPAPARARTNYYHPQTVEQLLEAGLLRRWHITAEHLQSLLPLSLQDYPSALFANSDFDAGITLFYAYLNTPVIGRNLLGEPEYLRLQEVLGPGQHALAVFSRGFYPYLEADFKPGSVPDRLGLQQGGLPLSLRDLNFYNYHNHFLSEPFRDIDDLRLFVIGGQSGFDPSAEMNLTLNVSLPRNHLLQDTAQLVDRYQLPVELFEMVAADPIPARGSQPVWLRIWRDRSLEIAVLAVGLITLTAVFLAQRRATQFATPMKRFRWAYLSFTLLFIGFFAQGQLSVVNIYTLILALIDGFSLDVFLLDPIIFILWTYTALSLLLWGRGLFCGWLCPFGALQEMAAWLANRLKIRQVSVQPGLHRRLLWLKYAILLALLGAALYSLRLAEILAEVEPFKTAITLVLVRSWPFVVYALALLLAGMFIHKFYCRYLCPLGAGLAILGRLRLWEWLDRRRECGTPCQMCRHRCGINAIDSHGRIDYDECIQCLECVVILRDSQQCAPARLIQKRARSEATQPLQWLEPNPETNSGAAR